MNWSRSVLRDGLLHSAASLLGAFDRLITNFLGAINCFLAYGFGLVAYVFSLVGGFISYGLGLTRYILGLVGDEVRRPGDGLTGRFQHVLSGRHYTLFTAARGSRDRSSAVASRDDNFRYAGIIPECSCFRPGAAPVHRGGDFRIVRPFNSNWIRRCAGRVLIGGSVTACGERHKQE